MISIFDLYNKLKGRVNVHQGGHIRPYDFVGWVHEVQMEIYNDRIADFQKTQKIADEITPFLESFNVLVINLPGSPWDLVVKPQGYENFSSARIVKKGGISYGVSGYKDVDSKGALTENSCSAYIDPDELEIIKNEAGKGDCEIPISLIDNDRWSAVCCHPRKKVTCDNPKMTQFSKGFKIMPKGCGTTIIMDFFRLPIKPVFNYTITNEGMENEYFQFVSSGSLDLEWPQQLLPEFINKLVDKFAIFVGDNNMFQQSKIEQRNA